MLNYNSANLNILIKLKVTNIYQQEVFISSGPMAEEDKDILRVDFIELFAISYGWICAAS